MDVLTLSILVRILSNCVELIFGMVHPLTFERFYPLRLQRFSLNSSKDTSELFMCR